MTTVTTLYALKQRHERAKERVAILTDLANRKTADPGRVLADLEAAVLEENEALGAVISRLEAEMQGFAEEANEITPDKLS